MSHSLNLLRDLLFNQNFHWNKQQRESTGYTQYYLISIPSWLSDAVPSWLDREVMCCFHVDLHHIYTFQYFLQWTQKKLDCHFHLKSVWMCHQLEVFVNGFSFLPLFHVLQAHTLPIQVPCKVLDLGAIVFKWFWIMKQYKKMRHYSSHKPFTRLMLVMIIKKGRKCLDVIQMHKFKNIYFISLEFFAHPPHMLLFILRKKKTVSLPLGANRLNLWVCEMRWVKVVRVSSSNEISIYDQNMPLRIINLDQMESETTVINHHKICLFPISKINSNSSTQQ